MRAHDTVHGEDFIRIRIAQQQRSWRDQGSHLGVVPTKIIDHIHAVAVTTDTAIDDVIAQIGDPGHRHGHLDAFVDGRRKPTVSASSAAAGDANPRTIDAWPAL